MSVDCKMSPALYCPDDPDSGTTSSHRGKYSMAFEQNPNFSPGNFHESASLFCESVSLAANGCVDWFVQWSDFGELEAFNPMTVGTSSKLQSGVRGTKLSQVHLDEALRIHRAREGEVGKKPRKNLELALSRWTRSKRQKTPMDKLIDLRIAFEALYEIGGSNEKGLRIATYGAWHLGENFQQRKEYQEILRKTYDASSRVVHGGELKQAVKNSDLAPSAQDICRDGILKRLEEEKEPKWKEMILGAE